MNAAYRPYFTAGSMPARATARTGLASPDYLVEITMVAVKDSSRKAITTPNADGTAGTANPNLSSAIQVGNRLYVAGITRSEEHTSELQSRFDLVCRLLLEKKKRLQTYFMVFLT